MQYNLRSSSMTCFHWWCFFLVFQKFFCGGRLIFGPDVASLFLSTLLIAGPAIAFSIKIYLKIKDTTNNDHHLWYPVLIVGSFLTVLVSFSVLCLSHSRDDCFQNYACAKSQSCVVVDSILTNGMAQEIFTNALIMCAHILSIIHWTYMWKRQWMSKPAKLDTTCIFVYVLFFWQHAKPGIAPKKRYSGERVRPVAMRTWTCGFRSWYQDFGSSSYTSGQLDLEQVYFVLFVFNLFVLHVQDQLFLNFRRLLWC